MGSVRHGLAAMLGVESEKRGSSSSERTCSPYASYGPELARLPPPIASSSVFVDKDSQSARVTIELPHALFQQCGLIQSLLSSPGEACDSADLPLDVADVAAWLGVALNNNGTSVPAVPICVTKLYRVYQVCPPCLSLFFVGVDGRGFLSWILGLRRSVFKGALSASDSVNGDNKVSNLLGSR
jgi:hypothetical protein